MFHTDATGAIALVAAVVAGLLQREQTGVGAFIDMSQAEAFAWQLPGWQSEPSAAVQLPSRTETMKAAPNGRPRL